jgi:2-methylcitrate dehydratase PrpD
MPGAGGESEAWRGRTPQNDYDAKFSLPYTVATMLVRCHVDVDDFTADAIRDPAVCTLAVRTGHHVDPTAECPRQFGGRLRVHLHGGRVMEHHQPVNRGSAERPLTRAEVESKFRRNAARALSRAAADAVVDAIDSLERYADLSALTGPLRP